MVQGRKLSSVTGKIIIIISAKIIIIISAGVYLGISNKHVSSRPTWQALCATVKDFFSEVYSSAFTALYTVAVLVQL